MNHNSTSAQTPIHADQIRINARLLYPYVINGSMPFIEYEDSLRQTALDLNSVLMGYRVSEDDRAEVSLNIKLATHFIMHACIFPKGAIAWVLLDEALNDAGSGDGDAVDSLLLNHWKVGIIPRLVQAGELHRFLCCETAFDDWFLEQMKSQRMVYGRDYFRIEDSNVTHPEIHNRDTGMGEIFLGHEAAIKAIIGTPTRRGKLASSAFQSFSPRLLDI